MSLINPLLLYGLGLIAVPVILHFLMRAKPKKLLFPALRLVQQRRMQNVRRLRLRHIWLLLLRMLVIAAIVFAVTRPSLPAADYGLSGRELLTLLLISAAIAGIYLAVMRWWQRQAIPQHTLASRRTYLRGGLGLVSAVLIALLVGWPYQRRIFAEMTAPLPPASAQLPAAAVFLFDTSLSMAYTQEGETRLELAKRIANQHLSALPDRSRVTIGDCASSDPILFQADLPAAKTRMEALKTSAVAVSLDERLRAALAVQDDDRLRTLDVQENVPQDARTDRFVREVYLFTDLAQSAWSRSGGKLLHDELQRLAWLGIYIIDVGVERPQNVGLTKLRLSRESVAAGGETVVSASLTHVGAADQTHVVELYVETESGDLVKKDQRTIKLSDTSVPEVQFAVRELKRHTHRGQLRLLTSDPLLEDNRLDFAVRVDPPLKILVAAPTEAEATYLATALEVQKYAPKYVPQNQLEGTELAGFDVVCLVNVAAPTARTWQRLRDYVEDGGGLAVFLGSAQFERSAGINSLAYDTDDAQAILPGELLAPLKFTPPESLDLRDTTHPVLQKFEGAGIAADLMSVAIRRYWKVEPHEEAALIASYTDPRATPALLERVHGAGRTILLTTAVDLTRDWSELARTPPWHFLALVDQITQYLSRRGETRVNYIAGDDVLLPLDREKPLRRYLLRKPSSVQLPGEVPSGATVLRIAEVDECGPFEVVSGEPAQPFSIGFSVNAPPGESDFARITSADFDNLLGSKRYSIANSIDGLQKSVTTGRLGVEVFPILLGLLVVVFCLEHTAANRFYQADQQPSE